MIALLEIVGPTKVAVKSFQSFEDAEEYARTNYNLLAFERDDDCDNCADMITMTGVQYAIEPA